MHQLYLAKGAMATTAIEGNTLNEDEVERRIKGELLLPPSKEYLGKEIDNVLDTFNNISNAIQRAGYRDLSSEDINEYNRLVLNGLVVKEGVIPGELRGHTVTVGRYRGAPNEDCAYLLQRLCEWLSGSDFKAIVGFEIVYGIIKAIVAHLYLAWIHPFGDGNGRTARLLEVRFLLEAGAPTPAAHLLSNFYNQTRSEYYRKLDEVSQNGGDIMPFVAYAVEGLYSQIREQIATVRDYQFKVTWQNYVHDQFKDMKTPSDHRRRHLTLALSLSTAGAPMSALRRLTPQIAELYAGKTTKTVARDVNALLEMGLLVRNERLIKANSDIIRAFLPFRRTDHLGDASLTIKVAA